MKLSHIFVILIIILLALCGLLLKMVISTGDVMFYVTEGMIALSIAFVLLFYSRVLRPIRAMVTGSDLLAQQDFSSRLRHVGQYEVDRIVDVFNGAVRKVR